MHSVPWILNQGIRVTNVSPFCLQPISQTVIGRVAYLFVDWTPSWQGLLAGEEMTKVSRLVDSST